MATAPLISSQNDDQVILSLDPNTILIGERIGLYWSDKAAALGKLIAQDGQNDPIKVRKSGPRAKKPWTLVTGLHRLEGVKMEGLRIVDAIEVTGDADQLRRIEASENIERRTFAPIERACFVRAIADAAEARVKAQHDGLTKEQIAIRARWDEEKAKSLTIVGEDKLSELDAAHTTANFAGVYGWTAEVAAAIGLSERSVYMDLALHRALIAPFPTLYADLARHPIVGENASALREIAAIKDMGNRRAVIEDLISSPEMTVAQAKEGLGLSSPTAPQKSGASKFMDNALSNLERLSAGDQRSIAVKLVEAIKPTALEAMRDAINARLSEIEGGEA